jgi:hypothetical protein
MNGSDGFLVCEIRSPSRAGRSFFVCRFMCFLLFFIVKNGVKQEVRLFRGAGGQAIKEDTCIGGGGVNPYSLLRIGSKSKSFSVAKYIAFTNEKDTREIKVLKNEPHTHNTHETVTFHLRRIVRDWTSC